MYVDDPKRVRRTVSSTSLETQSRSVSTPTALDQSTDTPPSSVHSPQPMRYPQLVPLLSISIPGGDEVPALESTSSSPASPSSLSTPLLGYQPGTYHNNFAVDEFGYDRCVIPFSL